MTEYPAVRNPNQRPMHPGELLREDVLPATGKSRKEIASLLGISRQHLYDILNEKKAVTAATALRLGKLFGNGPELWTNLQVRYDIWKAEHEIDVSDVPTLVFPERDKTAA